MEINNNYYYYGLIKKTINLVGFIFSDIKIKKGEKLVDVPITFGISTTSFLRNEFSDKEGFLRRLSLPRIIYSLDNISYDSNKKTISRHQIINKTFFENDTYKTQYVPNPYIMNFTVNFFSKYRDDIYQFLEQILPYFTPSLFFNIVLIEEMNESRDIFIDLNSVDINTNYDNGFNEIINHSTTLKLSVGSYLYGRIKNEKFIKSIQTKINRDDIIWIEK